MWSEINKKRRRPKVCSCPFIGARVQPSWAFLLFPLHLSFFVKFKFSLYKNVLKVSSHYLISEQDMWTNRTRYTTREFSKMEATTKQRHINRDTNLILLSIGAVFCIQINLNELLQPVKNNLQLLIYAADYYVFLLKYKFGNIALRN